jgi:polysaccharide biosynthesis protein PslJ
VLQALHPVQQWVARLNPRTYALLIGALVGILGGVVGLLIAITEPIIAIGVVLGVLLALYILSNVNVALYGIIAIMSLLPFGTIPVRIVFTPSLLDAALGAFVFVYLCQWMVGKRRTFTSTPVHLLILIYSAWLILCFVLGLRWAPPTSNILRGFAETLLAISMTFILVDFLRDAASLRRLVIILLAFAGIQAGVAIVLYVLPDATAETILVRLARLGYPDGGVIRYIEDTQALGERAIGTWIDPNALGGILAIAASTIAPQIFAERPVLRSRHLAIVILLVVTVALVLTFSRASMLAFAVGLVFIGLLRYRKFLAILIVTVGIVILLSVAQPLVERFVDAFTGADLATQMRIGEYTDSLRLISRYPIFGVGFTGTPDIDLYTDVASMYLIMANQIGLVGVAIYAATMLAVFAYGLSAWRQVRDNPDLNAIFLGYHAALLTALVNAVADLYFFRLDFQASITLFWMTVALALASARLARESTVENRPSLK